MSVALVTGASRGIGRAVASRLAEQGHHLVLHGHDPERIAVTAGEIAGKFGVTVVHAAGDIADPATAKALFEQAAARFGKVDILVNNAGIFIAKPAVDYTEADTDAIVATNLKGFLFPAQEAIRHMEAHGGGHIVNITAALGVTPVKATALLPVLIKGGLNMATRALALEVAGKNIKVNAVAPGIISTPLHGKDAATQEFLKGLVPTRRMGSAEDIADAVLYLTDSTFISGHVLTVDDGAAAGNW